MCCSKLLGELLVLLVAPGPAQVVQLASQRGDPLLNVVVELLQVQGEASQFFGIDDGLRHGRVLLRVGGFCNHPRGKRQSGAGGSGRQCPDEFYLISRRIVKSGPFDVCGQIFWRCCNHR